MIKLPSSEAAIALASSISEPPKFCSQTNTPSEVILNTQKSYVPLLLVISESSLSEDATIIKPLSAVFSIPKAVSVKDPP